MALLPKSYLDAVVSIGIKEGDKFRSLATGFLVGFSINEKDKEGNPLFKTFLVTNRHVFEGVKEAVLRFNLTEAGSKTYNLILEKEEAKLWMAHPNEKIDIAAIPVNLKQLKADGIKYSVITDNNIAFLNTIKNEGITQGDGIFVLGFPMGLAGREKNYVIVRSGIISRLDDETIQSYYQFYIDSTVFPGNSGGPVILRPEIASIQGTKAVSKAYLIGVIRSYIPYKERAISEQTGETRIVFIENSGIAGVVPMDFVKETVEPFMKYMQEKRTTEVEKSKIGDFKDKE